MKHNTETRHTQGKRKTKQVTSDHVKKCLTLSEVQQSASIIKQDVSMIRWSHKQSVDTRG